MSAPFKFLKLISTASFCFILLSSFAQLPTNGLKGYWSFSGNAIDSVAGLNSGTVYGARLVTDRFGKDSSAYYFDGNGDYIDCGKHSSLRSSTHTVNFWFRYSDTTKATVMVGNTNSLNGEWGSVCAHNTTFGLISALGAGPNNHAMQHVSKQRWSDDRWHMFTLIYDKQSNVLAQYIDACLSGYQNNYGSSGTFKSGDSVQFYKDEHWMFGAASQYFSSTPNNGPQYYTGALDDIRIYNRAINMMEIHALFHEKTIADTAYVVVYDTMIVYDTTIITRYDTTFVTIYDTTFVNIFDTTNIVVFDTTQVQVFDTNWITFYDTIRVQRFDTTFTSVTDTLYIKWKSPPPTTGSGWIKVYPNPTNGRVTIDFGSGFPIDGQRVKVYDVVGKQILEEEINGRYMYINLDSRFARGHYELVIETRSGERITVRRIILY